MGLDQYANRVNEAGDRVEVAYWRKHNRLQGWMEDLYISKGGVDPFNCIDVEITKEDLNQLEEDITTRNLPSTQGFFFGNDSYLDYESDDGYRADDLAFIKAGNKVLDEGDKLFYGSWW